MIKVSAMMGKTSDGQKCIIERNVLTRYERSLIIPLTVTRVISFLILCIGVTKCSFEIYDYGKQRGFYSATDNPNIIPHGALMGRVFKRIRDPGDHEWNIFYDFFFPTYFIWMGIQILLSFLLKNFFAQYRWAAVVPLVISLAYSLGTFSPIQNVFLLSLPAVYWAVMKTKRKLFVWASSMLYLYLLVDPTFEKHVIMAMDQPRVSYVFVVCMAWTIARCISFSLDCWESYQYEPYLVLKNGYLYCFYFTNLLTGPIVLYSQFEKNIILEKFSESRFVFKTFLCKMLRLFFITLICEGLLHFMYFKAMAAHYTVIRDANLWVLCGIVYWLGMSFALKYKVLYGIPSTFAEFEGLEMPPWPVCPSYLYRYSFLWKNFDRGLYNFLVRYTYVPVLQQLEALDPANKLGKEFKKLTASIATFCYVFVWHAITLEIFAWSFFNFLGITIESMGRVAKKIINQRLNIEPIIWDFFIEPVVTIPLLYMSLLNGSVFCGSLEVAKFFFHKTWPRLLDSWILLFIYSITHCGVMHKTYAEFVEKLKLKLADGTTTKKKT